jgi:hypothetical protein
VLVFRVARLHYRAVSGTNPSRIETLRTFSIFVLLCAAPSVWAQSVIGGRVLDPGGRPIANATVSAPSSVPNVETIATSRDDGGFRLLVGQPGVYTVTVRALGYRSVQRPGVRVARNQTVTLEVTLTQAPRQLSTINVVTSPVTVDASSPSITVRLDRQFTQLLPSARTATSLLSLVPGSQKEQLWGGAGGVANDYQLDGISMNHPGVGGDFLALSVDWIEALDVRGLGAGAEHGDFQGGVVNAITRTGSNDRRFAVRTNVESEALTASNFDINELGVEQAARREVAGEMAGPIARDRLFYFFAGQYVRRDMRSPLLATPQDGDFQDAREEHRDARAFGKLTWQPAVGQRVDLTAGYSGNAIDNAGLNGVDLASATSHVERPTTYYGLSWISHASARNQVELRLAGFKSRESRLGKEGPGVPGLWVLQQGLQPRWQNAAMNERREPSSASATAEWRTRLRLLSEHELTLGVEATRGRWREELTRNGGLTWRPYSNNLETFDPFDPGTWLEVGSEWGGEIRINSDNSSEALYVQDKFTLGSRLTLEPGIRYGRWSGYIRPFCEAPGASCYRFEAVRDEAVDTRFGIAWDITGHGTFAAKAHWGRYHQGMFALFFDRALGANVYSNLTYFYQGPTITDPRTTFTAKQRDAPGSGFENNFELRIRNQEGIVDGYRQPYVDQSLFALEKSFGRSWKGELSYTHRKNGDIVGLVDRNRFRNWMAVTGVQVHHRFVRNTLVDPKGNPLVLPYIYVSTRRLKQVLAEERANRRNPSHIGGIDTSFINAAVWDPDIVLSAIPEARREFDQVTATLRSFYPGWRAEGSFTAARLRGNTPGVTGYGTTSTRFTAGPFVNPNEGINGDGLLPGALQLEGKVWATKKLAKSLEGGLVYTHILGERFTPALEILGRYAYYRAADPVRALPADLFSDSYGQLILLEPRGDRHFASRGIVDAHVEWRTSKAGAALTFDLFNVLGGSALTEINTTITDLSAFDPTERFGAARRRMSPRSLRIGLRVD